MSYIAVFSEILEGARHQLNNIKPSVWVEQNRVMVSEVSPIPGMFTYDNSPYSREIIDCLSPDHPARVVAVMKGAQIGFSTGVIEGGIGWIISQQPGNILFLVGHEGLVKDAMKKVDTMIDATGIRSLIRSTSNRVRNTKSGDTDAIKEYPGGYLKLGIANHKELRNISMQYGFIDDLESMKGSTEQSGATATMIQQRFAAFAKKMKLFYISTPELKSTSNIEPQYLLGDQRKYHIHCPCCKEPIVLEWKIKSEKSGQDAGMTWQLDDKNELIPESVGYICYKCDGFFDDSDKQEMLIKGFWKPTAEPKTPNHYSYHISALYAPAYMYGWEHYVRMWLAANPEGQPALIPELKSFYNLVLGQTFEEKRESLEKNALEKNIRSYAIGTIPEKLSIADNNGNIILLTCGIDLNGKEDDARLDYEIVAFSESGATYSIDHGSIGTFIRNDRSGRDRKRWTYAHGVENSVWTELDNVLNRIYVTDTGRKMRVFCTGLDVGYQDGYAWQYMDNSRLLIRGLKGIGEDKHINVYVDKKTFRMSQEKPGKLYLVETNYTKDILFRYMNLNWSPVSESPQPEGYLNFPTPDNGKYMYENYFSHFEAEEKGFNNLGKYIWAKKTSDAQNHLYDCRLYALVIKDVFLDELKREMKLKTFYWSDYVAMQKKITGR
jgi:phage terminase large subunit GpA-like protein